MPRDKDSEPDEKDEAEDDKRQEDEPPFPKPVPDRVRSSAEPNRRREAARVATIQDVRSSVELGPRDILYGRLEIQGDLRVAGRVDGEVKATGTVLIEPGAAVIASIEGSNVEIRGSVTGEVIAKGRLTIGGSGQLNGDVTVARLTVEDGATLNGSVRMASSNE